MEYWKELRSKSPSPIETIIIAIKPVPRLRRGRQSPRSCTHPNSADTTTASTPERITGRPKPRLATYVITAPKVISSPCAKLVRPVVPKISERPRAASATIRPNLTPDVRAVTRRSAKGTATTSSTPIGKSPGFGPSNLTWIVIEASSGSLSSVPSGKVSWSSTTS